MITTVLLDVDNTLLDFNLCAKESMHLAAEKFGIALPENIFEIFHEIIDFKKYEHEIRLITVAEFAESLYNQPTAIVRRRGAYPSQTEKEVWV